MHVLVHACLWAAWVGVLPADRPPCTEVLGSLLGAGGETSGTSGARLGTSPQPGRGFTWGNSNPFTLRQCLVQAGAEEDAQGQQRAAHPSGWLGLHVGPGASEDDFKVAQAVGPLVQQHTCRRGFFKAEVV